MRRFFLAMCCAVVATAGGVGSASASAPEPDTIFFPHSIPPPLTPPDLQDPCGIAHSASGRFYLANYYRQTIDVYGSIPGGLLSQILEVDPLDGPCGLAVDASNRLYVNNYHRNVERYTPIVGGFGPPTIIDSSHPTGVAVDLASGNVYVDARTHLTAYGPSGAPLMDGAEPLKIGLGSLGDGYGLAISQFPGTLGRLYVPDHSDDTVKVYDPLLDKDDPVQVLGGPPGGFGSLRDSAVAVDRVTGEVYVADTLAYPQYTERPEATIHVFEPNGTYKGRLKYNVIDGSPPGLAVDNTASAFQGRVYVTSGNTIKAGIYVYPPGSATTLAAPASFTLAVRTVGDGEGVVASSLGGGRCEGACEDQVRAGAAVTLSAVPGPGSEFSGWTGPACQGTGDCAVAMTEARSVGAVFEQIAGPSESLRSPENAHRTAGTATPSAIAQKGNLRVTVSGKLTPRRLPRSGAAPISVTVGGAIATTDKSLSPQLKAMRIELNREGQLDSTGLPDCSYERIQPGSSGRALAACRTSLVGTGSFTANITLAGQEAYPTKGRLLLFNSQEKGKPVIYGHIYAPKPFATSFVIVFRVQKLGKGIYGTALNAPLPTGMNAWGRLTGLEMTLSRRYSHNGKRHSFISAGCPAPKGFPGATFPLARTEFSFAGPQKLSSTLMSACKARG